MSNNPEHQYQQPSEDEGQAISNNKTSTVKTERINAVFLVTIDRPQVRNAIDGPTAAALAQAFRSLTPFRLVGVPWWCILLLGFSPSRKMIYLSSSQTKKAALT